MSIHEEEDDFGDQVKSCTMLKAVVDHSGGYL